MSFSSDTKKELCKVNSKLDEMNKAEAYGLLLFCKKFSDTEISFKTESSETTKRFAELTASCTGSVVEIKKSLSARKNKASLYRVSIPNIEDCKRIFDYFGHSSKHPSLRINRANIENDECFSSFLRGVFLVCGNVTNPEKDYHMEFVVPHMHLASDLERIISEIEEIHTDPSVIKRKGSYVVYIKGSDHIADMLTYIGAPMSTLEIIQNKMLKSVRNRVNRKINSETANIKKTADASAKQLRAIELIRTKRGLDFLPDDLRELAQVRLDNPEYNLRELGAALSAPISRSGANHRIQRIMDIARELGDK